MPPVTQLLLDIYGWRGALWILGALTFNCSVCGIWISYAEKQRSMNCDETKYKEIEDLECDLSVRNENADSEPLFCRKMCLIARKILNVELFKSISFLNILIFAAASGWSFSSWLIYLIPHAEEKGISPSTAVLLSTMGGIANSLGKLLFPVMKLFLSNKTTFYLTSIGVVVALSVDPLMTSFAGLAVSSTLYAFTVGTLTTAGFAKIYESIENEHMIDAFSWFFVTFGMASMASGFTSGKTNVL